MRMRGDLVRPLALLAWSGFLFHLWFSGEHVRYVGVRTWWVVPFGAIALGLAGVAALVSWRKREAPGFTLVGAAILIFPVAVAVVAAPHALGSYAASRKAPPPLAPHAQQNVPVKRSGLTMKDLQYATQYDDNARAFGVVPGTKAEALGFVTHPKGEPPSTFALTRFYIWCCVADAEPFSAQIDATALPRSDYPDDTWLRVDGVTRQRGRRIVLVARTIESVDRPKNPYLYP